MTTETVEHGSPEWHEIRSKGIGGSDAAVILGLSPWKTVLQLWAEKRGILEPENLDDKEWIRWGTRLEPVICEAYSEETGREIVVQDQVITHPDHPFMIGHIDRRTIDPVKGTGVLEVKNVGARMSKDWTDEPPLIYQIQLQHYLAITGDQWGSLAALVGGQSFRWADIERNDAFIEKLIAKEAEFWRMVEENEQPITTGKDNAFMAQLYTPVEGKAIELPVHASELDVLLKEAKEQIKKWDAEKDTIEAELKSMIGDAEIGALRDGGAYSWKKSERSGYTVKPTTIRTLRRMK